MILYGIADIAEALGVPRERVKVWKSRGLLPAPNAVLRMGPVWTARRIEPWIEGKRREPER